MKKITLLFLALSSLALARITTTSNPNLTNTTNENTATAGINVNVSATVTATAPELVITDSNGTPISEVNFNHELAAGPLAGQGEQSLTANLRVKGSTLSETNYSDKLTYSFGNSSLTLNNGTNTLTSNIAATKNGFDNNGAIINVTSAIDVTEVAVLGTYAAQTTTFTVTYNKQ